MQKSPGISGSMSAANAQRRRSREGGQTLLEFAFLAPLLILIAIGIVEIGRATAFTIAVNNAATAGAEFGSLNESNAQSFSKIETYATNDANFSFGTITATATNGCVCDTGTGVSCSYPVPTAPCANLACTGTVVECVQVTTQGTWTSLFHYPGLPENYQANGQAVMRVQR